MSRVLARLGVLCGLGLAVLLGFGPLIASAHVTVHSVDAVHGGQAELEFQVTYQVTKTQLPSPLPDGHGGTINEVVGTIEWSTMGVDTAIKPGEYETFTIGAGPLPKTDRLIFKVVQTYDDGTVARWLDLPAAAGAAQPDHPAAVLPLAASAERDVAGITHAAHTTVAPATPTSGTSAVAWLAMAITGVAVLAALWAVSIAVRSARRKEANEAAA